MDKASKANQVRSFLTKTMLVPMEQVEKMSFQWIGIFPNKIEGSPPQSHGEEVRELRDHLRDGVFETKEE
uniref:Uncharacterized protein n=1 Tax=Romanomermis culicivorax TaxID=13658 RepID=A0A915HTA6_ROMCU